MKKQRLTNYDSFTADPVVKWAFVAATALWLASSATIAWQYHALPPIIPLFYSLVRGPMQLAQKPFILILPIMSFVFLLTQLVFSWLNYDNDMVFSRIVSLSAGVGVFIFSIAIWHIIWIVL